MHIHNVAQIQVKREDHCKWEVCAKDIPYANGGQVVVHGSNQPGQEGIYRLVKDHERAWQVKHQRVEQVLIVEHHGNRKADPYQDRRTHLLHALHHTIVQSIRAQVSTRGHRFGKKSDALAPDPAATWVACNIDDRVKRSGGVRRFG